jgi:tetratricopeptide (TPR) repeat protein
MEDLERRYEDARRAYDLDAAKALLPDTLAYVETNDTTESRLLAGRTALMVAQIMRLNYEQELLDPRKNRMMGRDIDDFAEHGHAVLEPVPDDVSEKWRIKADLWGTMIRSKYKGKRYGDNMKHAYERALELDPENVDALVTNSARPLFASPGQGGDVEKALEFLNRALELNPNHERALVFRGIAHEKLGNMDQSSEDLRRALEINPNSRIARENINSFAPPEE